MLHVFTAAAITHLHSLLARQSAMLHEAHQLYFLADRLVDSVSDPPEPGFVHYYKTRRQRLSLAVVTRCAGVRAQCLVISPLSLYNKGTECALCLVAGTPGERA